MALDLKIADAYVYLSLQRGKYDADMAKVQRDLRNLPGTVTIGLAVRAAGLSAALAQVQALRAAARAPIGVRLNVVSAPGLAAALAGIRATKQQLRSPVVIPIRANPRAFYRDALNVQRMTRALQRGATITFRADRSRATAAINLLMQHLREAHKLSHFRFTGSRGPGFGFGGGGNGGGGFLAGLGHGLGMPYAANPQMMAGQLAGEGVRAAVAAAAGMQSRMTDLSRVANLNAPQSDDLRKRIFGISARTPAVSVGDVSDIAMTGAKMGIGENGDVDSLARFTEGLSRLRSVIKDMPTEQLANAMGGILHQYKLGTDQVEGLGSALTALDNISRASASDILAISSSIAGTAASTRMTIPQVMALASVMKDAGISNQLASSTFEQIIRHIGADSGKFAAKIGVDAAKFREAYDRDVLEALGMVIARFRELEGNVEGQTFLDDLGFQGIRAAGSLQKLSVWFEDVGKRAKLASQETATLAALNAGVAMESKKAETHFQQFKNAAEELAVVLGDKLLPPITAIVKDLTSLTKLLSRGSTGTFAKIARLAFDPSLSPQARAKLTEDLNEEVYQLLYGDEAKKARQPIPGMEGPGKPGEKPAAKGLPDKPPPREKKMENGVDKSTWQKATPESLEEFKKAEGSFAAFALKRLGGGMRTAGGRLQVPFGMLRTQGGALVRSLGEARPTSKYVAGQLADVAARRRLSMAELVRALPQSQRKEFLRRAGQEPTEADRRLRPVFAQALSEARDRTGRFDAQRKGILSAAEAGQPRRHLESGMSTTEMLQRRQDDALNNRKEEERTAKGVEKVGEILGRIEDLIKKGPGGVLGLLG